MQRDLWVFAYGSLLWDPGFVPAEAARAVLRGYRRGFAMWSIRWRGTEEAPGLVLALEPEEAATCEGLALRVEAGAEKATLAALRARELVSDAYDERRLPVELADGRAVVALAYVIRPGHPQHARVPVEERARVIACARGARGRNVDYLRRTADRLAALGIRDPEVEALLRLTEAGPGPGAAGE